MTRVPVPARFARMLLFANQCQLMPYAVILVAALSVPNLFLSQVADTPVSEQEKTFQSNFVQQFVRKASITANEFIIFVFTIWISIYQLFRFIMILIRFNVNSCKKP